MIFGGYHIEAFKDQTLPYHSRQFPYGNSIRHTAAHASFCHRHKAAGRISDFLFTATTSICVTGLVVVDTYAYWSLFGQFVILILIQIGGLGVVAVASMIMLITGKKFFLSGRMLLGDSLNFDRRQGSCIFLPICSKVCLRLRHAAL